MDWDVLTSQTFTLPSSEEGCSSRLHRPRTEDLNSCASTIRDQQHTAHCRLWWRHSNLDICSNNNNDWQYNYVLCTEDNWLYKCLTVSEKQHNQIYWRKMSHRRASGDSTCVLQAYQAPQMDPNVHTHTHNQTPSSHATISANYSQQHSPIHWQLLSLSVSINNNEQMDQCISLSHCITLHTSFFYSGLIKK